jgi:hypothetical protein
MAKRKKAFNISDFEKNWDSLQYLDFDINNSIFAMRELLKNMEMSWVVTREKLDREIKDFEHNLNGIVVSNSPYEFEERLIEEIKERGYFAAFLSSYAILEGSLSKICNFIEDKFEFKIKLDDLSSRNHLDLYKNYLVKVYEIDYLDFEPEWTKISKYSKLRNLMTHEDGFSKNKEYIKSLSVIRNIHISEYGNSILVKFRGRLFFDAFLKEQTEFFNKIFILIDKKYPFWKNTKKR